MLEFFADWCEPCKAIGPKIEVSYRQNSNKKCTLTRGLIICGKFCGF